MSYGKVKDGFWTSKKVRSFSDDAKLLALYFISGPHRNILGCMRVPNGYITEDLGWAPERLSDAIRMLSDRAFLCRDSDGWTLILGQFEHDPLKNPNHAIAAATLANEVPADSAIYQRFAALFTEHLNAIGMASKWHPKAIATPKPLPEPEPLPEPDAEEARVSAAELVVEEVEPDLPPSIDRRGPVSRDRLKLAEVLLAQVAEIVGAHSASRPAWIIAGEALRWLDAGADPEADVLPTVRRIHAERSGKSNWPPSAPSYFAQPIADAVAARLKPMPEPRKVDEQGQQAETERGSERVARSLERQRARIGAGDHRVPGGDVDPVLSALSG